MSSSPEEFERKIAGLHANMARLRQLTEQNPIGAVHYREQMRDADAKLAALTAHYFKVHPDHAREHAKSVRTELAALNSAVASRAKPSPPAPPKPAAPPTAPETAASVKHPLESVPVRWDAVWELLGRQSVQTNLCSRGPEFASFVKRLRDQGQDSRTIAHATASALEERGQSLPRSAQMAKVTRKGLFALVAGAYGNSEEDWAAFLRVHKARKK